uniref:LLM class flavin-dependent oxidoreductase n=1 Tax=Nocardia abscessus TaxID=120957 RepID=UPI00313CC947
NLCSFPKPFGGDPLPIHGGVSRRAAARRAGSRGDGYFPGGMLGPAERATQLEVAHAAAGAAGRTTEAFDYTRWGSIDMPVERVEGLAEEGVTRVVVSASTGDLERARDELSAFADRFDLANARK